MKRSSGLLGAGLMLISVVLVGCPMDYQPPFNAAGNFGGTWSGGVVFESVESDVEDCAIQMVVSHNPNLPGSLCMRLAVVASLDPTCFLPEEMLEQFSDQELGVPILALGTMNEDGNMELEFDGCIEDLLDSMDPDDAAALEGVDLCGDIEIQGTGYDDDGDGYMDQFVGTIDMTLESGGRTLEVECSFDVAATVV